MPQILSSTQITYLTGQFANLFDSLARNIIINKQPIKTLTNLTNPILPGYSNSSQPLSSISFSPVFSNQYSGILIYERDQDINKMVDTKVNVGLGKTKLKVKPDAAAYINNGLTESISVDGLLFNVFSNAAVQNYLGLTYYYYNLQQTK